MCITGCSNVITPFFLLCKKDISSAEEAIQFKAELIKCRSKQMKQSIKGQQDCFTVSFNDNVIQFNVISNSI